jgi:Uma2 family endonuclease
VGTPSIPPDHRRLTVDDYMEMPEDGKRYELIDGDLLVSPSPVPRHQRVSSRLEMILVLALQRTGQGEVFHAPLDCVLSPHDVVQPDIIFIRTDRLSLVGEKNIEGAPDLAVEILSGYSRRRDVLLKSALYSRAGVPSYWILDPAIDRMELFRLEGGVYRRVAEVNSPEVARPAEFPGLEIPLAEVFA